MAKIEIPKFAESAPAINENCLGSAPNDGLNIVRPPVIGDEQLPVEVTAGFSMAVVDNSDLDKWSHEVIFAQYQPVSVALSITAKASTVSKSNPILKGTVIDEVDCSWSYNAARDGDIVTQTLVNTGATDPTLIATDRVFDYTALSIQTNETVTITGADVTSNDSDVKSITFGNYLATGVSEPSLLLRPITDAQAIFDALNIKTTKTTQAGHSFDAFGSATEFMVIAHPASFGESLFTKGVFTGGYLRIFSVNRGGNDIFVDEIIAGDVELDISIDNGNNGFTEDYFFYMSEFPARTADEPTIISKA